MASMIETIHLINSTYQQYLEDCGKYPSHMYLGKKEYQDLIDYAEQYFFYKTVDELFFSYLGVLIHKVDSDSHLRMI